MFITHRELLRLPVFTRSGQRLGRVVGFTMESDSQRLVSYFVRKFFSSAITVRAEQVVMLSTEKMIVEDAIRVSSLAQDLAIKAAASSASAAAGFTAMRTASATNTGGKLSPGQSGNAALARRPSV